MPDIHIWIDELTRSHTHREPYTRNRGTTHVNLGHVTNVPALVDQLIGSRPASSGATDGGGGAYGSRPAARIEALDTLMLIDDEATRWLARSGIDDPNEKLDPRTRLPIKTVRASTGEATIRVLNRLHGHHASCKPCASPKRNEVGRVICCDHHKIEADIRRWWHQARIITGWDSPAYRPFNTCPICDHRGGLRINLDLQAGMCIECRNTWTAEDIGLLAEHIRLENQDEQDADNPQAAGA